MMPVLIAVVALVGVLCALDLVLTVGVIKRLREHTELLSSGSSMAERSGIGLGEEIGAFATTTVDGEPLSRELLADEMLVGFFSSTCKPCKEELPKFVEYARARYGGRERSLAVVIGRPDESAAMVAALRPAAQVVLEKQGGPVVTAFQLEAFPLVLKVTRKGDGVPVVSDNNVDLNRAAAAR